MGHWPFQLFSLTGRLLVWVNYHETWESLSKATEPIPVFCLVVLPYEANRRPVYS